MLLKTFILLFGDWHLYAASAGTGIALIDYGTALLKLIAAFVGLGVVCLTFYHKWRQIKKDK